MKRVKLKKKTKVEPVELVEAVEATPEQLQDMDIATAVLVPLPKRGAPSKYKSEYAGQAIEMCRLGATDDELADFFDVDRSTIRGWVRRFADFEEATRVGKEEADERIERSLYHKAHGYTIVTEKIYIIEGKVHRVEVREYVPPDTTAAIFWLKNRRPDRWRDRRDPESAGTNEGPITLSSARQIFFDRVFGVAARFRDVALIEEQKPKG